MTACRTEWSKETGGPGRKNGTGITMWDGINTRGLVRGMVWEWATWECEDTGMINHYVPKCAHPMQRKVTARQPTGSANFWLQTLQYIHNLDSRCTIQDSG